MSVFDDFPNAILPGEYWRTDERNPLGVTKSEPVAVNVILDEGTSTGLTSLIPAQSDDILIYAQGAPLDSHKCIGGYVQVDNGLDSRTFKITAWNPARDQDLNMIDHFELSGQEVSS